MRIVFSLLSSAYLRSFESAVRSLAGRGHDVLLVTHERSGWAGSDELAQRLCSEWPRVRLDSASADEDDWQRLGAAVRASADYVHFLHPRYNASYRARAEKRVPPEVRVVADRLGSRRSAQAVLGRALPAAEALVPPSPAIERLVASWRANAVLFTPYVGLSTVQPAYLRACRALGIPTAVCVGSWDHLTSKSALRPTPDLVTVWNETQRSEAVDLHGTPSERVTVTGAQGFDHWFDRRPSPREEFCAQVGLDPNRRFLLYTCFSPFKGGHPEPAFVLRWIRLLRSSQNADLERAGLLIRPHPKRIKEWAAVDLSGHENVVLWPPKGGLVGDETSIAGYFDSIHHSAGVAGINTSAMIEAGIAGRRVHTLLVPEYFPSQQGTLHFRYLMEAGGGLLRVARSWGDHLAQLGESIAAGGKAPDGNRAFVESFVRPHGIEEPATPRFVAAIEALGHTRSRTPVRRLAGAGARSAIGPAARRVVAARSRSPKKAAPSAAPPGA